MKSRKCDRLAPSLLNLDPEIVVKANCFLNPNAPKNGYLSVGDQGIDFRAALGWEFVQVPWGSVRRIAGNVLFGRIIRSFVVHTNEGHRIPFVCGNAIPVLKVARQYLEAEKLVKSSGFLCSIKRSFQTFLRQVKH